MFVVTWTEVWAWVRRRFAEVGIALRGSPPETALQLASLRLADRVDRAVWEARRAIRRAQREGLGGAQVFDGGLTVALDRPIHPWDGVGFRSIDASVGCRRIASLGARPLLGQARACAEGQGVRDRRPAAE